MRPVLAIAIVAVVFGCVKGYMVFQRSLPKPQIVQTVMQQAEGIFSLEMTLTFDARADEFALEPTSAVIQFHGTDLLRTTDPLPADTAVVVEDVAGVVAGKNSFYVKVGVPDENLDAQRAIRLRVLRDGRQLAERTLWSAPGEPVEGPIDVEVPPYVHIDHSHEH